VFACTGQAAHKEITMKNMVKLFGIIALTAVIGFSMVACGGDDDGGNDGKTVTLSMDKVSATSFTLTVDNAEWKDSNVEYVKDMLICSGGSMTRPVGDTIGLGTDAFIGAKTSAKVITYTVKAGFTNVSGTVSLDVDDETFLVALRMNTGGNSTDGKTYSVNSSKKSVTLP
jgi:hypothetical protein